MSETTRRSLRLAIASLLFVALLAQVAIGMSRDDLVIVDFFSFFTILSNMAAVVLMILLAASPERSDSVPFSLFRGAVTVYMAVTGLAYAVLLAPAGIEVSLTEPWVDWSLHVIGPLTLTADWIMHPPRHRLTARAPLIWLGFPTAYLVYTLSRGVVVDWYPHPFLDPTGPGGYGSVAIRSGVVLSVILAFGYACLWWGNRRAAAPA